MRSMLKQGRKYSVATLQYKAKQLANAMNPDYVSRQKPGPVRTMADMSPEEIQAIYASHAK